MNNPNLILKLAFVPSEARLTNKVLKQKYGDKRKFYSCNQDNNIMRYVSRGIQDKLDYVSYSDNNEKSDGIFNQNGIIDKKSQTELKKQLRFTQSVIWHGVDYSQAKGQ